MLVFFEKPRNKKVKKLVNLSSKKRNMAIMKYENAIFEDDFVSSLEDLNLFFRKSRKIIKRSSEIENFIFFTRIAFSEDLLVILFGEMGGNSCGFIRKITERSSKNAK